jgi:ABC-2 type transport system permease protein
MIIVPLLMFPLMGSAVRVSMEATQQYQRMEAGLMDIDAQDGNASLSVRFRSTMELMNITPVNVSVQSIDSGVKWCTDHGLNTLVVVPAKFTESILEGRSADVSVYQVLRNYGFQEVEASTRVDSAISSFNSMITAERLKQSYPNGTAQDLLVPARAQMSSVINGKVQAVPPQVVITTLLSTSISMPMIIMILIIMASQLAATSVAMEKEQKTLEVLLTLPIKRVYILIGKITGVIVVSLVATVSYIAGFTYYMSSFTVGSTKVTDLASVGLSPDPVGLVLMMLSLFFAFISALSIAILISAYTKDVRSAQSLVGVLYIPILIPALVLMLVPVDILPIGMQAVIYGIPFSYPILAAKAIYTKDYLVVLLGIVYQVVFTGVILLLATKFFASEKVLTAKLEFKRKKKSENMD